MNLTVTGVKITYCHSCALDYFKSIQTTKITLSVIHFCTRGDIHSQNVSFLLFCFDSDNHCRHTIGENLLCHFNISDTTISNKVYLDKNNPRLACAYDKLFNNLIDSWEDQQLYNTNRTLDKNITRSLQLFEEWLLYKQAGTKSNQTTKI